MKFAFIQTEKAQCPVTPGTSCVRAHIAAS